MPKVITFSQTYPAYHPLAWHKTHFVEKFWASKHTDFEWKGPLVELGLVELKGTFEPKHHTIRAGHRFKEGEYFSPRIWSASPYRSKQIQFAPDTKIEKEYYFEIKHSKQTGKNEFFINGRPVRFADMLRVANNDGLLFTDLCEWFKYPKPFDGQIICWNPDIVY